MAIPPQRRVQRGGFSRPERTAFGVKPLPGTYGYFEEEAESFVGIGDGKEILITAGVGDFFAVDECLTEAEKRQIRTIYYATPQAPVIKSIINAFSGYSNAKHVDLWPAQTEKKCFTSLEELQKERYVPNGVVDLSISKVFPGHKVKSRMLEEQSQPGDYVAVHAHSQNNIEDLREMTEYDWEGILDYAKESPIVVLGKGEKGFIPENKNVINLIDKTSMVESIQIVQRSKAFWGVSSCLSVVAARTLPTGRVFLKQGSDFWVRWKKVYYGQNCHVAL